MSDYQPGALVHTRGRDWVVQPSADEDVLLLKPLDGSDEEITGVYLPLGFEEDEVRSTRFPHPGINDIGDFASARLLYDAMRLSFREGAGPFRCMGKLAFRPRSYQMVPLIMALRQEGLPRVLIADDVGVGKTVEALLVVKELLERRQIERFAVISPPHLCEQWQGELQDKFGIEPVIIRSSTQAALDRQIRGDSSVFRYYPYQVISIDYIKSDRRWRTFVNECPELVLVDEVHTCARPSGRNVGSDTQMRHRLIRHISEKENQGLVMLTATPHSGKSDEFRSLLEFIDPRFSSWEPETQSEKDRRDLARYYVQRRRGDVAHWYRARSQELTPFPDRNSGEYSYVMGRNYEKVARDIQQYAAGIAEKGRAGTEQRRRFRYWSALMLLRGVFSSPAAGAAMLRNRVKKQDEAEVELLEEQEDIDRPVFEERIEAVNDAEPALELEDLASGTDLKRLAAELEDLSGLEKDRKVRKALEVLQEWIGDGYHPVVFCRFIATAHYLGEVLKPALEKLYKGIDVQVVTSEDPDEVRKQRIDGMKESGRRVLFATDCLSEGINLQEFFTAVLHYDLPWNPNRLEQREGRVDRFGQQSKKVQAFLLYGNNPVDGMVLKVLLEKVREIRKNTGITIPFPEHSSTLLDAVMQSVFVDRHWEEEQLAFDFGEAEQQIEQVSRQIDDAAKREERSRSIFAQHAIKAEEIEQDLEWADSAIGDPEATERFVTRTLQRYGVQIAKAKGSGTYSLYPINLPERLKPFLPNGSREKKGALPISFESPVESGYRYLGRTSPFVHALCRDVTYRSFAGSHDSLGRAAVVRSTDVSARTVLMLLRARNVIQEKRGGPRLIAEEMLAWGYRGDPGGGEYLPTDEAITLLMSAGISADVTESGVARTLQRVQEDMKLVEPELNRLAEERAEEFANQHERFRRAVIQGKTTSRRYEVVRPVLPPDVVGVFVLLPAVDGGAE